MGCTTSAHPHLPRLEESRPLNTITLVHYPHMQPTYPSTLKVVPREDGLSGECAPQPQRTSAKTCGGGVQEWLSRSGACPLSISLIETAHRSFLLAERLFLDAIRPFASRWRRLVLHGRNQSVIGPFSSLLLTEVPILEELESTGGKNDPDDKRWSRCGLFAPQC